MEQYKIFVNAKVLYSHSYRILAFFSTKSVDLFFFSFLAQRGTRRTFSSIRYWSSEYWVPSSSFGELKKKFVTCISPSFYIELIGGSIIYPLSSIRRSYWREAYFILCFLSDELIGGEHNVLCPLLGELIGRKRYLPLPSYQMSFLQESIISFIRWAFWRKV